MPRLIIDSGVDKGMVYQLAPGISTIGRSANNTIQLIDKRTSRHHAEFRCEGDEVYISDLASKNGVFVNDTRLVAPQPLHNGDQVQIGDTVLVFERDPDEPASASESSSSSVRLVADLAWGHERGTMQAGVKDFAEVVQVKAPDETRKEIKEASRRLQIIYQIVDAIRTIQELEPLLEKVMDSLFAFLQPDRAFIMIRNEKTGAMEPRAVRFFGSQEEAEIAISQTIVDRCLQEQVSLLVSDALSDMRFRASESVVVQRIRSAICAPMICRGEVMGVIYLDTKSRPSVYDREELELATGIANQTALGILNLRLMQRMIEQRTHEREMEIAKEIQMRLLPRSMPKAPNYDFSGVSLAAKKVGGDYYDLLSLENQRVGIALADVSGKGVPAAILIASVRSALQAQGLRTAASPSEILEHLNEQVYRDTAANMFVTMVYGVLDCKTSAFEYANAGHPYPLLFHPGGAMKELEIGGCFLGIAQGVEYAAGHAALVPGSILVLYSDGVTDTLSPKGELYGRKRLIDLIQENMDKTAQEIRDLVFQDSLRFRGDAEQFDDFTLVIVTNTQSATS